MQVGQQIVTYHVNLWQIGLFQLPCLQIRSVTRAHHRAWVRRRAQCCVARRRRRPLQSPCCPWPRCWSRARAQVLMQIPVDDPSDICEGYAIHYRLSHFYYPFGRSFLSPNYGQVQFSYFYLRITQVLYVVLEGLQFGAGCLDFGLRAVPQLLRMFRAIISLAIDK